MPPPEDPAKLPLVTIAFCSLSKLNSAIDVPARAALMSAFSSCVRTTLMLLGGVECQEKDGEEPGSCKAVSALAKEGLVCNCGQRIISTQMAESPELQTCTHTVL